MDRASHDNLSGRLRGLLVSLDSILAGCESVEVSDLLDHDEFGEALRTLAWLLVEEDKKVDTRDLHEISSLAEAMNISDELPDSLDRCAK